VNFLFSPRSRAAFLAITLTLLGAAQASARRQQTVQQPLSPSTVSGHIFRADNGGPLPKATVTLTVAQPTTATSQILPQVVRTDSSGAFQFTQVAPGKYFARADHIGFVAAGYGEDASKQVLTSQFTVGPGQNLSRIDITLLAAGVISGTITDQDGDPVENLQVSAIRVRYVRGGARQEVTFHTAATNDQGNYRLFGLIPGFYFVRAGNGGNQGVGGPGGVAYQPAYYPGSGLADVGQRIQVAPGVETSGISFSIGTQLTHKISGTVIDTTGPSESRRYIMQLSRGSADAPMLGAAVQIANVSGADGSFALNGVPSGDYTVSARSVTASVSANQRATTFATTPEFNSGSARVRVNDADVQVNITVTGSSEIKGKVSVEGAQGPPPQAVHVNVQSQIGGVGLAISTQNAVSDTNGNFDIHGVAQGEYNFDVTIPGQNALYLKQVICAGKDYTIQPLAIEAAMTLGDCVITLGVDAGSISGQVMDSAGPMPGLVVVAIPETRALRSVARYTAAARTDDNGQFTIAGVIPGDYFVFAVKFNDEQTYFAPDFAEANIGDAERVTIHASEAKSVNPKPPAKQ
jgi:hypothetical protein